MAPASEVNDGADRDARTIRGTAGIVEAHVVKLRAQRHVGKNTDIHAAANAIGEVGIGTAAGPCGEMPGTRQELNKRSELSWVVHDDARAEEKRVCIQGYIYSVSSAVWNEL